MISYSQNCAQLYSLTTINRQYDIECLLSTMAFVGDMGVDDISAYCTDIVFFSNPAMTAIGCCPIYDRPLLLPLLHVQDTKDV